jgi:hypothetical protein
MFKNLEPNWEVTRTYLNLLENQENVKYKNLKKIQKKS